MMVFYCQMCGKPEHGAVACEGLKRESTAADIPYFNVPVQEPEKIRLRKDFYSNPPPGLAERIEMLKQQLEALEDLVKELLRDRRARDGD